MMSAIDQHKHRQLGFIHCPSGDDFVMNNPTRTIALYELLEDIPVDEKDFDGKAGDILIGGGSGEAPAFRVSVPQAMYFFTKENPADVNGDDELFKSFWSAKDAAIFSEGYAQSGWNEKEPIEFWLAKNICLLLIENFEQYSDFRTGKLALSNLAFVGLQDQRP